MAKLGMELRRRNAHGAGIAAKRRAEAARIGRLTPAKEREMKAERDAAIATALKKRAVKVKRIPRGISGLEEFA